MTTVASLGHEHPALNQDLGRDLAGRIESGEYARGSRLPSEGDFMEELELGRSTVRRAMAWLREQGLAETVPTPGDIRRRVARYGAGRVTCALVAGRRRRGGSRG